MNMHIYVSDFGVSEDVVRCGTMWCGEARYSAMRCDAVLSCVCIRETFLLRVEPWD